MSEMNYEKVIGLNIKKERLAKGLSQNDLGNKCQIANTVISAYENGKKTPGLDTVAKIAKALGITIDQLCYGDESESFINSAPNEGRKIVNCIYTLWKANAIYYFEQYNYDSGFIAKPSGVYLGIKPDYSDAIKRLINSLNEFAQKNDTFPDPDVYLESILSSVANEINKRIYENKK